jgi:cytoskeletal protein CcmA (bactofilin family)
VGKEKGEAAPAEAYTILPRDAKFAGTLIFEGAVQIDGDFEGQIITEDLLVIGAEADVRAQMSVGAAIIQGSVQGDIDAKSSVEVKAPGCIRGSVTTPHLIVEEGAAFGGFCKPQAEDENARRRSRARAAKRRSQ